LIDADTSRAQLADQCGLAPQPNIGDVLTGRKNIHESLQRAPAGMQILAGSESAETAAGISTRTLQRLERQLLSLRRHADWIIVDAGHQATELTSQLWSLADQVLLVTAPDAAAVMDTYALVKTLFSRQMLGTRLLLVVNSAENPAQAADVFRRVDQSCRRFLGASLGHAGFIPPDPGWATRKDVPVHELSAYGGALSEALSRLTRYLTFAPAADVAPRRMAA
jgi:flagellar biosynthesis protein FlhG